MTEDSLIEFPSEFPIKAIGHDAPDFQQLVVNIIAEHVPSVGLSQSKTRPSSNGKFLAVTVTFTAVSKPQLDAVYQSLCDHDRVVMVL